MSKPTFSLWSAQPLRLRRVAGSATLASALLVTCWSVGVGARQASVKTPNAPPGKSAVPSPTTGKTTSQIATASSPDASSKTGKLRLDDFDVSEETGIGVGHKFVYTTADGDTVITGENGRIDKKNQILDADTNLVLDNSKNHITGDKSHVEMEKSRLVVMGNVILTLKPEKTTAESDPNVSVGDAKKQGAVVTCDEIESFYKRKFNILRGHLIFKQHILRPGKEPLDRTGTAEHAEYDGKKEILVLFPPVHGEDSDHQKFVSEKHQVTIYTKAGHETMKGLMSIVEFPVKEADDDEADAVPTAATTNAKPTVKPTETPKTDDAKKPDEPKKDTGAKDTGKPTTNP